MCIKDVLPLLVSEPPCRSLAVWRKTRGHSAVVEAVGLLGVERLVVGLCSMARHGSDISQT
tara:strand:- start:305 stop:487 length:183 start_codon:yes stop_codon:yes gene_type:complete